MQQTPRDIEWGDGTGDEMCLMSVLMTLPREDYDYSYAPTVHIETPAYRQQFAPGELVPLKLLLNNFTLHDPGMHDHADATMHMDSEHAAANADHSQVFEGHYHVYLDTDDDTAEHLTAWDSSYFYQLARRDRTWRPPPAGQFARLGPPRPWNRARGGVRGG